MNSSRVTMAVKAIMGALSYTLATGKEGETDKHGCQPQNEQGRQPDGKVLRFHRWFSLTLPGRSFNRTSKRLNIALNQIAPAVPKQFPGCNRLTPHGL
jgi:hypothetical protein